MTVTTQDGQVLRLQLKQDTRLEYRCHTEITQVFSDNGQQIGDQKHEWDTRVIQRVIRTEGDLAHLLTVSEPAVAEEESEPTNPIVGAQVQRQAMYAQIDSRGQMKEVIGGVNSLSYCFPETAVVPGYTWDIEAEVILPGMPQPGHCTNRFTVVDKENVCGFDCLRIDMVSSEANFESILPGGQQKAVVVTKSQGCIHFAPKLGLLVRIEQETTALPQIQAFSFKTVTKVVQELVKFDLPQGQ